MKKSLAVFSLLTACFVASVLPAAEIYVREDPQGRLSYSDQPSPDARRLEVRAGVGYRVVRTVFDGDTLLLDDRRRVRLLGINAPEVESSRKSGESGGAEARLWLKNAVEGKKIRLEGDVDPTDRYQRILAHVFTEEGTHINQALVRLGLAAVNIYPPNLKYAGPLLDAQQLAESERLGIWGDPAYTPKPIATLTGSREKGWRRLLGRPLELKASRKYYRLIYSAWVEVKIPRENLNLFPDLTSYLGCDTEIRGWPLRRKNQYSILVRHPSALRWVVKG